MRCTSGTACCACWACAGQQFAPGTLTDIAWWTKWTKGDVRAALSALNAADVTMDDGRGEVLAGHALPADLDPPAGRSEDADTVHLLPALDSTTTGWKERDWYLDRADVPQLFETNGNAGPVVMVGGEVIGAWGQVAGGTVVTGLLHSPSRTVEKRIAARAAELSAWLDGTRVTPRFPTPRQQQLAAG